MNTDVTGSCVLWYRPTRRHKWREVGSAPSGPKALELMDASGFRNGEWMVKEDGLAPDADRGTSATPGPSDGS